MAEKELRRMNRAELIEIIYAQQQEQERLQGENEALSARLADRTIHLEQAGSIAEAALALNGVFEAAQAAADQYTASVQAAAEQGAQAQQLLADARSQADALLEQTEQQCAAQRAAAQADADARWEEFRARVSRAVELSPELRTLMERH